MRNITCEHCGSSINIDKEVVCPNCKAPYNNNTMYKELLKYEQAQRDVSLENDKANTEIKKQVASTIPKVVGVHLFIFIFVFIIILGIIGTIVYTAKIQMNDIDKNFKTTFDDDFKPNQKDNEFNNIIEKDTQKYTGLFNENVSTANYDIKVNKVIEYIEKRYTTSKETYYGFNIVFNNKTDKWQTLDEINLTYTDKDGNENVVAKKPVVSADQLDFFATQKLTYTGFKYFDIPSYVKDVKIVFKNVEIIINDYKSQIK